MKFKVADLRVAVQRAVDADRARFDEREQAHAEEYDQARAKWVAENTDVWRQACDSIRAALRRKEPITRELLPYTDSRRYPGSLLVFDEREPRPHTYTGPGHALERVRVALALITDDEVSTTALQQLGVSPGVLRDFLDLVPGDAE